MCKQLGNLPAWLVALVLGAIGSNAAAVITLDGDFDHGALESFSVSTTGGGLRGGGSTTVNLVGRDNFYGGGRWRWLNFRADGISNQSPTFEISDNFAGGGSRLNNHEMVYSYDNENWLFFDNNTRDSGNGVYRFSNSTPFTQDSVYVAYAQPYSYGRSVAHTQQVLASPWAMPTSSATGGLRGGSTGVIGQSPGGVDDLGRTIDPRNIYAYRITNPATDSPTEAKRKVVISTGQHAGETLGTHTYAGMVDWLISDDPRAAALRDVAEFYAYPTLNPDGRFAGHNRSTVENPNQDPNGLWSPSKWIGHEDIQINGEAMIADTQATPGIVDAYIDFHSTIPTGGDDFGFIEFEQNDNQVDWWRFLLDDIQTNLEEIDSTSPLTSSTSANFAEIELGSTVDVTFENQFGLNRPLEYYYQLGEAFGLAFYLDFLDVELIEGDANFDGFVSQADLDLVLLNWGDDEAFGPLYGDLSGDQIVSQADLDLVLLNWGDGTPPAGLNTIPEPGTALAALAGVLLLVPRRRRAV